MDERERRLIEIHVPILARVEGEGALEFTARDGKIKDLKLRIYEPPRFFEKFFEGRLYSDIPDLVARICGICPVAYQMSAVQAFENALGVQVSPWVHRMRRLFYCGEWIQSHALHIHLLAAPDFLGHDSVIGLASEYPEEVRRGMRLQNLGNRIVQLVGARSVHPVGARVGGFHHAPSRQEAKLLGEQLEQELPQAEALVGWTASLDLPGQEQDFVSVALHHPEKYPMYDGRILSREGLDIEISTFQDYFTEHQVPHSTALHSTLQGKTYMVGPLARMNLNWDRLDQAVQRAVLATDVRFPSRNIFHSIVARAAEINQAMIEAADLLQTYEHEDEPFVTVQPGAGTGMGCTEAPRGILWHRYDLDEQGRVRKAVIIPPTSQNQARIEEDLRQSFENYGLYHSDNELRAHGETVIRNYDPCISCATHFLKLKVRR